jgi:hypothetical protein
LSSELALTGLDIRVIIIFDEGYDDFICLPHQKSSKIKVVLSGFLGKSAQETVKKEEDS